MIHNYQIIIEYEGTKFVGWQYQKNGSSIQETLEKNIKKILKEKIKIIGAGRTDSGVHALGQSANFFVNKEIKDLKKFQNSINFFLSNNSISIKDIKKKRKNFIQDMMLKREFMNTKLQIDIVY